MVTATTRCGSFAFPETRGIQHSEKLDKNIWLLVASLWMEDSSQKEMTLEDFFVRKFYPVDRLTVMNRLQPNKFSMGDR